MQKSLLRSEPLPPTETLWFDLGQSATVEISSEDSEFPIEAALLPGREEGWHAAEPGDQVIRLIFNSPQFVRRIQLLFIEERLERVQEFVLRWRPADSDTYRDILRQQYVFSPGGATQESEDYSVNLKAVAELELRINPDISRKGAFASLRYLRIG